MHNKHYLLQQGCWKLVKKIIKLEKIMGWYNGLGLSLYGTYAINSMLFFKDVKLPLSNKFSFFICFLCRNIIFFGMLAKYNGENIRLKKIKKWELYKIWYT